MLNVPKLESEIPKDAFKELLRKEAPCLLATLLSMRLPTPTTRLRLPVVETYEKTVLALNNTTQVELFVNKYCESGDYITVADFSTAFEKVFGDKPDNRELRSLMSTRPRIRKGPSVTRKIDGKTTRVIVGLVLNDYGLKLMQPPAANGSPTCVPLLGPFSTTSGVESIL